MTTIHDALFERRSVRDFTAGTVGNSTIESLLAAAVRAPTAFHEVPWRFLIVQERSTLKRISDRAKEMSADQMTHLHQSREHHLNMFSQLEFNVFYNAGTLIVICARFDLPFAVAYCWLATKNLKLKAQATGLGTCVSGSAVGWLYAADIKTDLGIPQDHVQ